MSRLLAGLMVLGACVFALSLLINGQAQGTDPGVGQPTNDRNGDGIVTVSELYEYVEDQVDRAARLAGGRQRPLMKGEIEGTLPLSRAAR